MTDVILRRSTRPSTAAGLAGLFGLFAGLCAIFAGCVTLGDWYGETKQARWPVVSAVVDRADIEVTSRAPKDGGTVWHLRARVRYEAGGEMRTATVTSCTAFSEQDAEQLQSWAAAHRKGSRIEVRYDQSQPNRAEFASADIASTAGRVHTDLILFAIAAIAAPLLLALARFLSARAAAAAPVPDDPQRGGLVAGSLFALPGVLMLGLALHRAAYVDRLALDDLMGLLIALMFVLAGIFIGLPPQYRRWRNLLQALIVTFMALTFDWVAFGAGERHFTGSAGGIAFVPGEMTGRILFGLGAVVLDICAVAVWAGLFRRGFGAQASTPDPADSRA
jgi:hypothetical protein